MLDRLPQNRLLQVVTEARNNNLQNKALMRRGADAILMNRLMSTATYDYTLAAKKRIKIVFNPNDMTFGGNPVYRLKVRAQYVADNSYAYIQSERQRPEAGSQVWIVTNAEAQSVRIKLYFSCVGSGNFSITALN